MVIMKFAYHHSWQANTITIKTFNKEKNDFSSCLEYDSNFDTIKVKPYCSMNSKYNRWVIDYGDVGENVAKSAISIHPELEQIKKYIKSSPSYLVENAVTPDYINLKLRDKREKKIVTIGGIRSQKDPENFAKIAKEVREKDQIITFSWIGDGDNESKKLLIDSGVEVTGWIDTTDVKNILLNSTIYLSTAKWEGMPISILEALACGLPTIAFNCPGNADIIKDRDIGFVFNSNDEAINKILNLLNNKNKIDHLSLNAYSIVNDWFNLERYNKEINEIIKRTEEKH